jgi:hypothetical protein
MAEAQAGLVAGPLPGRTRPSRHLDAAPSSPAWPLATGRTRPATSDWPPRGVARPAAQAVKFASAAVTTAATRPGASLNCQYRLVWEMTLSGVGAP